MVGGTNPVILNGSVVQKIGYFARKQGKSRTAFECSHSSCLNDWHGEEIGYFSANEAGLIARTTQASLVPASPKPQKRKKAT